MYPYKNVLFLKNGVIYPYKIQKPKKKYRNISENNKTKKAGESKVVCSKELTPKLIQIHRNKKRTVNLVIKRLTFCKEMATHASILAWEIPWTEQPGGLQSAGSQRVGYS